MKRSFIMLPVMLMPLIALSACSSGYRPFSAAEGVDYTLYPAELDGFSTAQRRQIEPGEVMDYGREGLLWPYSAFVDRSSGRPADGDYNLNLYAFDQGYATTLGGER